jgi:gamma-polyglutamate biosynthesis protein CapA
MKKFLLTFCILLLAFLSFNNYFHQSKAIFMKQFMDNKLEQSPKSISSIDEIFMKDHDWVDNLNNDKKNVLLATGDVLLARSVNYKTNSLNDFTWPFKNVADELRSADITFINLETPLVNNCPLTNEGMIFCGDPRNVEGLVFSGVDIANIANNHMENYGEQGLNDTLETLRLKGITPSGISGAVYKNVKGINFAFLGYSDFSSNNNNFSASDEKIIKEINEAKDNADIIVVQFHWGSEYTTDITNRQRSLAYLAIDSGADLIIGNHPHWIQPIEIYKDKLIAYGHGNFIFDQEWSEKTKLGIIGKYTFFEDKLIDVEYLPIKIENYGQPYFLEGVEKQKILDELNKISAVNSN